MNRVENLRKNSLGQGRGGGTALENAGVHSTLVNSLKPSPKPSNPKLARRRGATQAIGDQMQLYCRNGILPRGPWSQM